MVSGTNPIFGSTYGRDDQSEGRQPSRRSDRIPRRVCDHVRPGPRAEQAARTHDQHERHHQKQHDLGIAGIEHRCEAEDLARDQAAEHRARERADAADDHDDESLDQDGVADVGRDRRDRDIDDSGEPAAIAPMPNTIMKTR